MILMSYPQTYRSLSPVSREAHNVQICSEHWFFSHDLVLAWDEGLEDDVYYPPDKWVQEEVSELLDALCENSFRELCQQHTLLCMIPLQPIPYPEKMFERHVPLTALDHFCSFETIQNQTPSLDHPPLLV